MPRDGSGTYSRTDGTRSGATVFAQQAAASVSPPLAPLFDAEANDMATAISDSLAKDGQTPMTGNLNLNMNKIVGLETGTADSDAVNKGQVDTLLAAPIAFTTLTWASPLAWNVATDPRALVTVTGDISAINMSGMQDGGFYVLRMAMDGTGGHSVTLPTGLIYPEGIRADLTTTALAVNTLTVFQMGTARHAVLTPGWAVPA